MTTVVATYYWTPDPGSKFAAPYSPDDVRRLQRMVAKNTTVPHQFAVITDRPELFCGDPDVRAIPIDWTTHVRGTCYVRLMTFHPKGREMIGDKVLQLDLDTLIVGNIDHLLNREEELVLWRQPTRLPWHDLDAEGRRAYVIENSPDLLPDLGSVDWRNASIAYRDNHGNKRYVINQLRTHYNTSLLLHRCGTLPKIWRGFFTIPRNPDGTPEAEFKDDQWYLSKGYGMHCPYFDGARDGVYRIGREDTPGSGVMGELPANACIVTFPGDKGKWTLPEVREANPWIAEYGV